MYTVWKIQYEITNIFELFFYWIELQKNNKFINKIYQKF